MRLSSLTLEQFRSFKKLTLEDFSPGTNVLVGPNGSGKTNILEAISFLSLGTSCIGAELQDVIRWNETFFRLRGAVDSAVSEAKTIEIAAQAEPRKQKAFFVNDVKLPSVKFIGQLPSVTFLPEDLDLFTGSPSRRRTFLDQLLLQISSEFRHSAREYEKVVKQRNTLLRRIKDGEAKPSDLAPWDSQIAHIGAEVTVGRLGLIDTLNSRLAEELTLLGEHWEQAELRYVRKTLSATRETIEIELLELITHYRERDMIIGSTTIGPHRDDWMLTVQDRNIATFASRGQQRTAVLALLFKQINHLAGQIKEQPVVLLDDVFSELDERHQELLLTHLGSTQTFLTTTHAPAGAETIWRFTGAGTVSRDA